MTDFCEARLDESKLAATSLSRSGSPESMRGVPAKDAARCRYGVKSMSSSEGGSFAHRIRLSEKIPSLPLSLLGLSEVDSPFLERVFFGVAATDFRSSTSAVFSLGTERPAISSSLLITHQAQPVSQCGPYSCK